MRYFSLAFAFASLAAVAVIGQARAADDTYVSAAGADAGDCAVAAPCASLRYALKQTTPGGTIVVLTSGRYGAIDITKSVHIEAKGVQAIVDGVASCKAVICINAGASDVVSLRGLTIQVQTNPNDAIAFYGGRRLDVEGCATTGIARNGILFAPGAAATLRVFDSTIAADGQAIDAASLGGIQRVVLDGDKLETAAHGLVLDGSDSTGEIHATLRNSAIGAISGSAIIVDSGGGAVPESLMLDRAVLSGGAYGIDVRSAQNAIVRMGDSLVTGYWAAGINNNGDTAIASYGTNKVVGNEGDGVDGYPLPTIPLK